MSVLSVRQVVSDFRLREPKWLQSGGKLVDHDLIWRMINRAPQGRTAKLLQGEESDLDYSY